LETVQRQLSEYLQCELYHLLGAYGVAEEHLDTLAGRLPPEAGTSQFEPRSEGAKGQSGAAVLDELVRLAREYNHTLAWHRYASDPLSRRNLSLNHSADEDAWPVREPLPSGLPMTDIERFRVGPKDKSMSRTRKSPWSSDRIWDRIPRFYAAAIAALEEHRGAHRGAGDSFDDGDGLAVNRANFARSLLAPREGPSNRMRSRSRDDHLRRRINRYEQRLAGAIAQIGPVLSRVERAAAFDEFLRGASGKESKEEQEDFLDLIVNDRPVNGQESLSVFVLRVQAEAHLSMHAVEAWRSMCVGEHAEAIRAKQSEWLERELERSIALSTFAYCVSRTAPWIFARNEEERRKVITDVSAAWEHVVPIRCMWIASQIGLLSLHRRAYARALQGRPAEAYNDYHKLQHLIRDTERRITAAPLHVGGARGFLAGLNAEAHHHIGELYRAEHAHKPALEHFEAASHRLELLRKDDETFDEVMTNSRWYVELQISRGKACYEMGRHKEALHWHLRAWHAFLELLSSETMTETNTDHLAKAIEWLDSVKFEPELRKSEISERIGPVVEQLDRITAVGRVGALAAEILLRLGHLLFVLNVGYFDPDRIKRIEMTEEPEAERTLEEVAEAERFARRRIGGTLAFSCLAKAAECDPYSTLVGADLMKTRFRFNTWWGEKLPPEFRDALEYRNLKPIEQQWPRGGSNYERLARIAEYLMLKASEPHFEVKVEKLEADAIDGLVARDLLLDLFMSTDSINVRKSQIHRFLMTEKKPANLPHDPGEAAIEFICMRRYSSPFPLLPRPSAFRALGGGYFIRLHQAKRGKKGRAQQPYGVVVDPGVDFVENLYRAGYSLGDINMVVITHDHVDHLGGLDPLLSLLHVRTQILRKQSARGARRKAVEKVAVLTSRSVHDRYKSVSRITSDSRNFSFQCFETDRDEENLVCLDPKLGFPQDFEILAMSSAAGAEPHQRAKGWDGHRDLSNRPSLGLCFRRKGTTTPSVAITADTPPPPPESEPERYREWLGEWGPALAADILVVHLGSIPLTELRLVDGPGGPGDEDDRAALARDENELKRLQEELEDANHNLKGQIEYAQWLRSHDPDPDDSNDPDENLAPIVGPVPAGWLPPPEHNFLAGVLRWAREYGRRWWDGGAEAGGPAAARPQGLIVIGELSEELGTMRGKVATRLNLRVFDAHNERLRHEEEGGLRPTGFPYALTADIGLHACVYSCADGITRVEVLCTNCNLDADRTPQESYHASHDIYEVCVKGENEGIFYNCLEHDPARQDEPAFLEQLERFDIFGR
jgi:tetratricopeptide (TPR) repeat protein